MVDVSYDYIVGWKISKLGTKYARGVKRQNEVKHDVSCYVVHELADCVQRGGILVIVWVWTYGSSRKDQWLGLVLR